MLTSSVYAATQSGLSDAEVFSALDVSLENDLPNLKKVLLLPPDFTRFHSGAGLITSHLYQLLKDKCTVDIMPALGTHAPVNREQWEKMFCDIP